MIESLKYTYPKKEKLKSHTVIDSMFSQGKTVSKYPLRIVYIPVTNKENLPLKVGVSVSKRYFKKAVDRNYFKRLLRESYRLNKHLLINKLDQPYAMMIFYQTKDRLNYEQINHKMVKLMEKFIEQINKTNSTN
ncbi:ribonuclease P protein component [Myroides sp. LJL119]